MSNMNMEHAAQIEQGLYTDPYLTELAPHESKLSNFLYILSFAPPFPSPFRKPRAFISHPYTLYILGTLSAMVAGVGLPAFDIVFGYWTNGISRLGTSSQDIQTRGNTAGWIMTMIGVVTIACFAAFLTCFSLAGIQLSNRLREQYLAAILVQDQAFFDRIGPGEIVTRASKDVDSVRVGLGERLGYIVWSASSMLACLISAFVHAPRLAGFLFAIVPTTGVLFTALGYWSDNVLTALAPLDGRASSLIEQILSSVRIVQSFDLGPRLIRKLEHDMLGPLRRAAKKKSGVRALEQATVYGLGFLVYCMAYWFGGIEVARGLEVGDLLTTFFNVINCSFLAASLVPHLVATSTAVTNLSTLRLQIERKPPIDVRDPSGTKLNSATLSPSFELQNVTFAYPSRPSNKALDDVSVTMEAGKFTAFVGPSGSGKSTAASLLLRLYDPGTSTDVSEVDREIMAKIKEANGEKKEKKGEQEEKEQIAAGSAISGSGTVRFAGHDIQTLNLKWLRSQVAVVLQNPQLVSGTVFDNVAVGLTGTDLEYRSDIDNGPNPSPEDKERMQRISQKVEEALKKAQAWDFVCALPDGLETKVTGGRTGVLSGGQVQRVALARALVREPKCLLLDEATSAVSADTEQKIQEALLEEQRQRGMTLIVIAHRLSTIVAADRIFVMVAGRAVHSGTYDELLQPDCPDQTFRSMALVKHTEMPSSPASSSPSESSTSLALSPSTPKVPTPEVPHQVTIPPRMLKTSKAFLNVKYYLIVGFFVGLAGGASFAIAAWLHGRAVNGLRIPDIPLMRATSNRWALWYLVLAIVTFFVYLIFVYGFEYGGEHIVGELRRESVRALIRQDIAFFESGDTGTGGLTAAATTHPSNVGNVVGLISAQAVSSIANLLAVTIMSFVLTWRLAVMVLPALGVTMLLGRFNFDCLHKFEKDIDVENSRQADFVGESANSVQMIAALTREAETMRQFKLQFTAKPTRRRWLFYGSVAMGGSQGMLQLFAALMFHWGSKQLAEGRASLADLYTVIEGVVIAIYISARILTFTGDFTRMNASLKTIQYWMDREPVVGNAIRDPSQSVKGDHIGIEFRDVELRYPSRPKVLSLDKVNLCMEPGKSYAFCGTSGAGKSSILAVLQRFYDPTAGAILLDGVDIRDMDVKDLRSQMGYVSQEPILFEETVRWNLASGAIDPESVTDADLESACEEACMMPFIRSLPQGFDTPLGMKGGQLSGGQRQRLCIARALLRKPRILLLDEATSALDGQSEAKVQQALDNASRGRMTVTIAHRLSTIRKADVISVMEQGRIVESGSHEELLALKGRYLELVQAQL